MTTSMLSAAKVHAYLKKGLVCAKYKISGTLYVAPTVVVAPPCIQQGVLIIPEETRFCSAG